MIIKLITDELFVTTHLFGKPHKQKTATIPVTTNNLLVCFNLHIGTDLSQDIPNNVKSALDKGYTIVYVCDRIPRNKLDSDNIIYIETTFRWFIHTLFYNPLMFKGIILPLNASKAIERTTKAFSVFTKYKIPVLKEEPKEDAVEAEKKVINNILFEVSGGLGDLIMSFVTFKHLTSIGINVDVLVVEPFKELCENQPYIRNVFCDKKKVDISKYEEIKMLSFGQVLNDYRLELNRQNRIYSIAEYCNIKKEELKETIPDINIPENIKCKFRVRTKSKSNKLFFGIDSNRVDARLPIDIANKYCKTFVENGYTVYTASKRNIELTNATSYKGDDLTVMELIALISCMDYVVTVDTSYLHIAGALRKKTVALYTFFPVSWRCSTYPTVKAVTPQTLCYPCISGYGAETRACVNKSCFEFINKKHVYEALDSFNNESVNRPFIAIESNDGIGDILMAIPSLKTYDVKGYNVVFVTKKPKEIVANLPYVYDVIDSVHKSKYNFEKHIILTHSLSNYNNKNNTKHRIYASANMCGLKEEELVTNTPEIILTEDEINFGKQYLDKHKPTLVVSTHAVGTYRGLSIPKTQIIIDSLRSKYNVVYVASEKFNVKNCINLSGQLNLRQYFSVINACDIVFTVDTGTLHVAGGLNKKVVALFGPVDGDWRCSTYKNCVYIQSKVACSPCADGQWVRGNDKECVRKNVGCLEYIPNYEIINELDTLLKRPLY